MEVKAGGLLTENVKLTLSSNSFIKLLLTTDASTSEAVLSFHHAPKTVNIHSIKTEYKSKYKGFL